MRETLPKRGVRYSSGGRVAPPSTAERSHVKLSTCPTWVSERGQGLVPSAATPAPTAVPGSQRAPAEKRGDTLPCPGSQHRVLQIFWDTPLHLQAHKGPGGGLAAHQDTTGPGRATSWKLHEVAAVTVLSL